MTRPRKIPTQFLLQSLAFLLLSLLQLSEQRLHSNNHKQNLYKSPFEGVPEDKHILTDESGNLIIRLEPKETPTNLRNTSYVSHEEIPTSSSLFDSLYELLIGNDEESEDLQYDWSKFMKSHSKKQTNKKRLQSDTKVNLDLISNILYYGPVYMGTSVQKMTVVYDTGSDWLVIESSQCTSCNGTNYDTSTSTSYVRATSLVSYHYYGTAGMMGFNSTDDVYLDSGKTTGVTNFLWFLVLDQYGIATESDGILGMCRNYETSTYSSGPLYIEYLYNSGKISNKIFAFYLTTSDAQSFVQIGTYDTQYMKDPNHIVWITSPDNFYWNTNVYGFKYGSEKLFGIWEQSYEFKDTAYPAILDSGNSLIYLPNSVGVNFLSKILEGKMYSYYASYGMYLVSCDTSLFEPVYLYIDDYWFPIHPSAYIITIQSAPQICGLGFLTNSDEYFILGGVFLKNYYAIFDMENNRVGFSPHTNSQVSYSDMIGDAPKFKYRHASSVLITVLAYTMDIVVPIVFILLIIGIFKRCNSGYNNANYWDLYNRRCCGICCKACCCWCCYVCCFRLWIIFCWWRRDDEDDDDYSKKKLSYRKWRKQMMKQHKLQQKEDNQTTKNKKDANVIIILNE